MTRLFTGSLTAAETDALKGAFVRLASILRVSENTVADAVERPVPDSAYGRARRAKRWDAYEQVNPLVYSAEDHLRTILTVFRSGTLPTYALYTLLRAAAIAVVRCAYLLDPGIDEQMRMARGLNVRWENLKEQSKLKDDNDKLFAERVAVLEQRATSNGITVFKKDPDKPATDFGERRVSDVELFAKYLKPLREEKVDKDAAPFGETAFRFLSGHVHSMLWVNFIDAEKTPSEEAGIQSVKFDLHFEWFGGALSAVLRLHESNIKSLLVLSGYPVMVWNEAMKSGVDHAKAEYVRLAEAQAQPKERTAPNPEAESSASSTSAGSS
jgi:hypothetical protein